MDEISWQAREFYYTPKSPDWYWILGIISVVLAVVSLLFGNLLFSIVVLAGGVALGLQAAKHPNLVDYRATDRGIMVDDRLYLYQSLASFWIEAESTDPRLIVKSSISYMPYIVIHIENIDPDLVRDYLLQFLPEEPMQEPLSHKLAEYLGL